MASTFRVPDPACPWVTIETPEPKFSIQWRVTSFLYEPGAGNTLFIQCVDDKNVPQAGEWFYVIYPSLEAPDTEGGSPYTRRTDVNGKTDFGIFSIQRGTTPGPYHAEIRMTGKDGVAQYRDGWSEIVHGIGNHGNRHDKYTVKFQRQNTALPPPVPPPHQTLEEIVQQVTSTFPWMPVNNTAALWKYAQAHGLQDQQTDELHITYGGEDYIAQVFNLGIVYVKVGDWGNIKVIPK